MKSIENFKNASTQLTASELTQVKGGNAVSLTLFATIDICTVDAAGNATTLFCDRRRKKIGA